MSVNNDPEAVVEHQIRDAVRQIRAAFERLEFEQTAILDALSVGARVDSESHGAVFLKEAGKVTAAIARLDGAREIGTAVLGADRRDALTRQAYRAAGYKR